MLGTTKMDLTEDERRELRRWWDTEQESDTVGAMLANLDATVARLIEDRHRQCAAIYEAIAEIAARKPGATGRALRAALRGEATPWEQL